MRHALNEAFIDLHYMAAVIACAQVFGSIEGFEPRNEILLYIDQGKAVLMQLVVAFITEPHQSILLVSSYAHPFNYEANSIRAPHW